MPEGKIFVVEDDAVDGSGGPCSPAAPLAGSFGRKTGISAVRIGPSCLDRLLCARLALGPCWPSLGCATTNHGFSPADLWLLACMHPVALVPSDQWNDKQPSALLLLHQARLCSYISILRTP